MLAHASLLIAGGVGVLAAVDPNNSASWVGGAAALTLLTIAIGFNASTLVRLRREVRDAQADRHEDQRRCDYQISVLVEVLDTNGIPMPGRFWDRPPDLAVKANNGEHNRRSRMRAKNDDDGWVTSIFLGTVVAVLAVFAIFALVLNGLVLGPLKSLQNDDQQTRCVASLTADYFVAIDLALAAPPDSSHRNENISIANAAAERVRNRVAICADGKPDPFKLPPLPYGITKR